MDKQTHTNTQSGFTIVEAAVAFVLFSLVTLSLVSITEYVQYSQRQSIYITIANNAAHSKITEYTSKGYDTLTVGQNDDFSHDASLNGLPQGSSAHIMISQPSTAANSKQLNVTITYPVGSTTKQIVMKAYVTDGKAET